MADTIEQAIAAVNKAMETDRERIAKHFPDGKVSPSEIIEIKQVEWPLMTE